MSALTSTSDQGPDPTLRRGVVILPSPPSAEDRANQNDSTALPRSDDGFAQPIENGLAIRAARNFTSGAHPSASFWNGDGSVGVKTTETYAVFDGDIHGNKSRLKVTTTDRISINGRVGGLTANTRFKPDYDSGMSLMVLATGGGHEFERFGLLEGDGSFGRERVVTDLGCREDNDAAWHRIEERILTRGDKLAPRRSVSQRSFTVRPERDVEIKDVKSYTLFAGMAPRLAFVQARMRGDLSGVNETRYIVPLAKERAWQACFGANGWWEMFRDFTAGRRHQDLAIPQLSEPDKIAPGSKLTSLRITNGQFTIFGGANLSSKLDLIGLGLQRTAQSNVQYAVKRSPYGNNLDVAHQVLSFRDGRWSAGLMGTQVMSSKSCAKTWNYDVSFIRSTPEGQQAYLNFVAGRMPAASGASAEKAAPWNPTDKAPFHFDMLDDVAAYMNRINGDEKSAGTRFQRISNTNSKYSRRGASLRFLLLPNYYFQRGQSPTLNFERVSGEFEVLSTDGCKNVRLHGMGANRAADYGLYGKFVQATHAEREWSRAVGSGAGQTCSSKLHLITRFYSSRTRSSDVNRLFVEPLNRMLRLPLAKLTYRSIDLERVAQAESTFTDKDIARLWDLKIPKADEFVLRYSTGINQSTIDALLRSVRADFDRGRPRHECLEASKEKIQRFVYKHQLAGMGLVHQLLKRSRRRVRVTTNSDYYQQAHKRADTLLFRYEKPITLKTSMYKLRSRWLDVQLALQEVERGIEVARNDGLLPAEDRHHMQKALLNDLDNLRGLLVAPKELTDAERAKVVARLRSGWLRPRATRKFAQCLEEPTVQYGRLNERARALASKIAPLQPNATGNELRRHYKLIATLSPELQTAMREARVDWRFDREEDRRKMCAELQGAAASLGKALSCSHMSKAQRAALRKTLAGRWWQTSADKKMIKMLDEIDSLAPQVASGRLTHEQADGVARIYGPLLQQARAYLGKHTEQLQAGLSAANIRVRFSEAEVALRELTGALDQVDSNRLLTVEQRSAARREISQAVNSIRSSLSAEHLASEERQAVVSRVRKCFWLTSLDSRIACFLEDSNEAVRRADMVRHMRAGKLQSDVRDYAGGYVWADSNLATHLNNLKNDVFRSRHRLSRDEQNLRDARRRLHEDLWDRRAEADEVFESVCGKLWWPSAFSVWTHAGRYLQRALRRVPSRYRMQAQAQEAA